MTRNDLIRNVSRMTNIDKSECEEILDAITSEIKDSLINGEKVFLKNFITFEISQRPERQGRNPKTGESVIYPPVKSINCRISKSFKDAVNGKRE